MLNLTLWLGIFDFYKGADNRLGFCEWWEKSRNGKLLFEFFFLCNKYKKKQFYRSEKKIAQHYIAYNNTNLMNYVVVGNNLLIKM